MPCGFQNPSKGTTKSQYHGWRNQSRACKITDHHKKRKKENYCTKKLQSAIIHWYHLKWRHPGQTRTLQTIKEHFDWPGMSSKIKEYVKACEVCQKFKITVPKIYGKIPLKNVTHVTPFEHIQVDLAGPWKILLEHEEGKQAQSQIWISTILDIGSNWIKMHPITNKQSPNIAQIFNNEWLCQYPRPIEITYDRYTRKI